MTGKGNSDQEDWINSNLLKDYGATNLPVGAKKILSSIYFMNPSEDLEFYILLVVFHSQRPNLSISIIEIDHKELED